MGNLEELQQKVVQTVGTPDFSLGEILQEAGITQESGESIAKFLEDAGISQDQLRDKQALAGLIMNMAQELPPEMKGQFKDLVDRVSTEMNLGPVPPEISAILSQMTGK